MEASPVRTLEVEPPLATAMGRPRALAALATATTGSMVVTCQQSASSHHRITSASSNDNGLRNRIDVAVQHIMRHD